MKTVLTIALLLAVSVVGLRLFVRGLEPRAAFFPFRGETTTPAAYGIEFERVTLHTSDDESLAAWWLPAPGDGPEVLFLHGNGGNLSLWSDVIVGIRRRGWSVFALDYRGYGLSTGSPTEQGIYRDADAFLEGFWSRFHEPDRRVIYWGRSLGATVAAYMTSRRPPDGLVLEAPFYSARTLIAGNPLMRLLSLFMSYQLDTAGFLQTYPGPTLVVHGDADRIVPLRRGRRVFDELTGPKRLVVLPGADHNDLHLVRSDLYWAALEAFVAETDEGSNLE
jgi:uncharacterized protein